MLQTKLDARQQNHIGSHVILHGVSQQRWTPAPRGRSQPQRPAGLMRQMRWLMCGIEWDPTPEKISMKFVFYPILPSKNTFPAGNDLLPWEISFVRLYHQEGWHMYSIVFIMFVHVYVTSYPFWTMPKALPVWLKWQCLIRPDFPEQRSNATDDSWIMLDPWADFGKWSQPNRCQYVDDT